MTYAYSFSMTVCSSLLGSCDPLISGLAIIWFDSRHWQEDKIELEYANLRVLEIAET